MKSITLNTAEREIPLQSVSDLTAAINATRAAIEVQLADLRAAAESLMAIKPDPAKTKALLGTIRSRRAGIVAQIRAVRSGLLDLQCSALAAWEAAGEPSGETWEAVEGWSVTTPASVLLDNVAAAMMGLSNPVPLLFAKYADDETGDPLYPESAMLGEDAAFLETAAEALELDW